MHLPSGVVVGMVGDVVGVLGVGGVVAEIKYKNKLREESFDSK